MNQKSSEVKHIFYPKEDVFTGFWGIRMHEAGVSDTQLLSSLMLLRVARDMERLVLSREDASYVSGRLNQIIEQSKHSLDKHDSAHR